MIKSPLAFENTSEIKIPKDPFERIIGQEEAVRIAKMVPAQRRHLLLVGPPGTGKSMIAQAIASLLPKPKYEISIVDNPEIHERPIVEIRDEPRIKTDQRIENVGTIINPVELPSFVAERFGFRCRRCGGISTHLEQICPHCTASKYQKTTGFNPFERFAQGPAAEQVNENEKIRVATSRKYADGKEEIIFYDRHPDGKVIMLTEKDIKKLEDIARKSKRKVLVSINRNTFVQASGGTETELLGDIRHDPYGGHPHLGTPAYLRVLPGAVHESHEGVLFIDELSTLGNVQRYLLTAMQEKSFPIVGRNPTSSGAAVRVDAAPCDFIFVGACNINDLKNILPPMRSRIRGDGYEVLMNGHMDDTKENEYKVLQFIAQEITKDGKIPHAQKDAALRVVDEARSIAKRVDNVKGLTLRLRNLSGIIKMAGDFARAEQKEFIEKKDVEVALKEARPIEERIKERYGNWWSSEAADYGANMQKAGPETA
ncbi:ATP-binding protein [Candidatus Micrarchaeota archaeon]|nr:ATP-binding protein [Candidatus Micrarchaeota archaeon]